MTTQLRQAIALLELSNLDLQQFIEQQALENPLLSCEAGAALQSDSPEQISPHQTSHKHQTNENQSYSLDYLPDQRISLFRHIYSQIDVSLFNLQDKIIADALCNYLDPCGYLEPDYLQIEHDYNVDRNYIERIILTLQQFEPAGLFAKNLQQCLTLQAQDSKCYHGSIQYLLENLTEVANGHWSKLAHKSGCSIDALKTALKRIQNFDPKPGLRFDYDIMRLKIPEIQINFDMQQQIFTPQLLQSTQPRILVDWDFMKARSNSAVKKYLTHRHDHAKWLIHSLQQRQENMLKVAAALCHFQQQFFHSGITALVPLTLKEVAQHCELHESTVSRITRQKYLSCHFGIIEFKYFFSSTITNQWTGEDQSSTKIQHIIHQLIKAEDQHQPLSDDQLVKHLCNQDILVARRTVTKYREALDIPSSYARKKHYRIAS